MLNKLEFIQVSQMLRLALSQAEGEFRIRQGKRVYGRDGHGAFMASVIHSIEERKRIPQFFADSRPNCMSHEDMIDFYQAIMSSKRGFKAPHVR